MNGKAIFGLLVVVAVLVWGILLGGRLSSFVDVTSGVLVLGVTFGLLVATHGLSSTVSSLFGGLGRLLVPGRCAQWTPEEAASAANIASSAIRFSLIAGVLGGFIGLVTLLQSLDDPSAMGPPMAVMVLSAFYALLLIMAWFLPVSRRFS